MGAHVQSGDWILCLKIVCSLFTVIFSVHSYYAPKFLISEIWKYVTHPQICIISRYVTHPQICIISGYVTHPQICTISRYVTHTQICTISGYEYLSKVLFHKKKNIHRFLEKVTIICVMFLMMKNYGMLVISGYYTVQTGWLSIEGTYIYKTQPLELLNSHLWMLQFKLLQLDSLNKYEIPE